MMADREYMTSQSYSATIGGIQYAVSVQMSGTATPMGWYNVKAAAYGAVGDGSTDDTAAIQAAVDVAEAAGGGTVYFPAGTYKIATGVTIDSDNIHILGDGIGATVIGWQDGNGAGGDNSNGDYIFTITDANNVSFEKVSLTNGPSEDIGATNTPNAGGIITATGSTKIRIRDCYLYEIGGSYGFVIRKCSNVKVTDTTFYMISYAGMMVLDTCFDIKVTGCTFDTTNSSDTGYNRYLFATGATTLLSADGTNAYFLKDLLVSGNTFKDNAVWEGIDTHGGDRITITNNTVTGCYIGINAINATSSGAAYVTDASLDDLIISENTIEADGLSNGWFGVVVRGHDAGGTNEPWFCENSKIINNSIRGYGGPDKTFSGAITVYRARNVEITGNHIDDFAQTAVMLYTLLSGVRVKDNTMYNAGTTHQNSDRVAGVTVRDPGMDDVLIENNRFFDDTGNWDYGIYGWAGSDAATVVIEKNENKDETSTWTGETNSVASTWISSSAAEVHAQTWMIPPGSGAGTAYMGGYYVHSGTANTFAGGPTWGVADDEPYAAHFFVVLGATAVDEITLTVTGTTIDDLGVRTASSTDTITILDEAVADTYYETSKKFLGQVVITVTGGTAKTCDFGWVKYWDAANTDFTVTGLEMLWEGGGNGAIDCRVIHHKATGWTYTGSGATNVPNVIASLDTDYDSTDVQTAAGSHGAWKRTNLSTAVAGASSEGVIVELDTAANNQIRYGQITMNYVHT